MNRTASLVLISLIASSSQAFTFSGDPLGDGWRLMSRSTVLGGYSGSTGSQNGFDFDTYRVSGRLGAQDQAIVTARPTWQTGDALVGLGFYVLSSPSSACSTVTFLFGSNASRYSASSTLSAAGDGSHSHRNGDGGLGSVQMRRVGATQGYQGMVSPDGSSFAQWAGTPGQDGNLLASKYGLVSTIGNFANYLRCGEAILNLSEMGRDGLLPPTVTDPTTLWSQPSIVTLSSFDGQSSRAAFVAAPEPGIVALLVGGIAIGARRKR